MTPDLDRASLVVVVGAGGVGKTTLAAALGLLAAREGHETLVMTFDPSKRLKDTLGVGEAANDAAARVAVDARGGLHASLLDPRATFDRLVVRYAPDAAAARRILENRFYQNLAGHLAGLLEYMAVERLFEVASEGAYGKVILDTPPTRQALDFLGAPERVVDFLESGALRLALRPWFDAAGRLKTTARLGPLGRQIEGILDRVVGLGLLRDMAEFFQAFAPLYEGFKERALRVQELLRAEGTLFVLVTGPGEERIPEAMFFARQLEQRGHRLGPLFVNMLHPAVAGAADDPRLAGGRGLMEWLAARDRAGLSALRRLVPPPRPVFELPLLPEEPAGLTSLGGMADLVAGRMENVTG